MKCYLFDLSKTKFNINMFPSSICLFSVILGYTNCIFFNVISQVNKPYLPLASGEYSVKTGVIIVSLFAILVWKFEILNLVVYTQAICVCGFLFHGLKLFECMVVFLTETKKIHFSTVQSFWLGWIVGSWPLFWALFVSFVLGTAYSINVSCFLYGIYGFSIGKAYKRYQLLFCYNENIALLLIFNLY